MATKKTPAKVEVVEVAPLAVIPADTNVSEFFRSDTAVSRMLDTIERLALEEVDALVGEVSDPAYRKAVRAVAYKVSRTKTVMDGAGKMEVDRLKAEPAAIDKGRKTIRDELDKLRDSITRECDEYEQAAKEWHASALLEIGDLRKYEGLLFNSFPEVDDGDDGFHIGLGLGYQEDLNTIAQVERNLPEYVLPEPPAGVDEELAKEVAAEYADCIKRVKAQIRQSKRRAEDYDKVEVALSEPAADTVDDLATTLAAIAADQYDIDYDAAYALLFDVLSGEILPENVSLTIKVHDDV